MNQLILKSFDKNILLILLTVLTVTDLKAQQELYPYEPSPDHPYGLPNPEAPPELLDFNPLIGESQCQSVRRNPDQTWGDTINMIWRWKYIANGMAVQDETLKTDGNHSGSIRQYIADSSRWYVHFYSTGSPSTILKAWEGNQNENGDITLYKVQKAPNGTEGFYKINFTNIKEKSFSWLGEWVNTSETISFPTWKIFCTKTSYADNKEEKDKILLAIKNFSSAYMNADYVAMTNSYASDAKIFPNRAEIIQGHEAIKDRWVLKNGAKILKHEVFPEEIKFLGNYAYDYGYYEGRTLFKNGNTSDWKGKYVIVWKKENDEWKMYLDIWNMVE